MSIQPPIASNTNNPATFSLCLPINPRIPLILSDIIPDIVGGVCGTMSSSGNLIRGASRGLIVFLEVVFADLVVVFLVLAIHSLTLLY